MGPKLGGKLFFSICEGLIDIHDYYFDGSASPNFKQILESSEAVFKSTRILDVPAWPCTTALLLQNLWAQEVWENVAVSRRNHSISATIWDPLCLKAEILLVGFYRFIFNEKAG